MNVWYNFWYSVAAYNWFLLYRLGNHKNYRHLQKVTEKRQKRSPSWALFFSRKNHLL